MSSPLPIPAHPRALTPDWMSHALRAGGNLRRGSCIALQAEIIGADRGFTGVVARVRLDYDTAGAGIGAPPTLIAKFPTANRVQLSGYRARQQQHPEHLRLSFARARREVAFYQRIAPASPLRTPRLYFAAADEATANVVLLLEDIADGRPGDALTGCSPAEARAVLLAMASFHARWWDDPATGSAPWLPTAPTDPGVRQARFAEQAARFLAVAGNRVPAAVVDVIRRLGDRYATVIQELDQAPKTLLHADLHLDNLFFTTSDSGTGVVLLDWQTVTGAAAIDIAPFVATSLAVADRRAHEMTILRQYHAALVARGVTDYAWDRFLIDYRRALLVRLAGTIGWLANTGPARVAGREGQLIDAALDDGRLVAALSDHDLAQLLE